MNNINKHNNGSADHYSDNKDKSNPEPVIIINCVLNAPLMLISFLGNALVLAAIMRTPSIRSTPHMIMPCSLAVSDFLVGLIVQPIYIAKQLTGDHYVSQVSVIIGPILCIVSLMTITAIYYFNFPVYVLSTLYELFIKDWQSEWQFAFTAVFMNSSINPFLYCWRLSELRSAVVKTGRQILCKHTEEN